MNCDIGFHMWHWSDQEEQQLAELLSSDRGWDPPSLTPDELRLWARLDPGAVALWVIDALEAREGDER